MRSVFRSVDLPEVAEVVDSDHVVFAVEFEQVDAYPFPLVRGKFMSSTGSSPVGWRIGMCSKFHRWR